MHAPFQLLLEKYFCKKFSLMCCWCTEWQVIHNQCPNESTDNKECDFNELHDQQRPPVDVIKEVLGNVSLKLGKVVSLTIFNQKGFFQKNTQGFSGKSQMQKVCTSQITIMTI